MRIWNGCGTPISGVDVADRADVDLRARQERHGAVEVDRVAALDLVEDDAVDLLVLLVGDLELDPALLAASLVARDHGLAERILDTVEIDLDLVADDELAFTAGAGELAERDATLGLQTDVDDRHILLDGDDLALDDGPFEGVRLAERFIEKRGEVLTGRVILQSCGHVFSWTG